MLTIAQAIIALFASILIISI